MAQGETTAGAGYDSESAEITASTDGNVATANFRRADDDFMNACLNGNIEGTEPILRIILNKPDIVVKRVTTQKVMKNLLGRDIWLDIDATDASGTEYDIEIQRADKVRYFKEDEKGVASMCKVIEDMRNEVAREVAKETAEKR